MFPHLRGRPITWKEFYGAYESMLGSSCTIGMTYKQYRREVQRGPSMHELKDDLIALAGDPHAKRIQGFHLLRSLLRLLGC